MLKTSYVPSLFSCFFLNCFLQECHGVEGFTVSKSIGEIGTGHEDLLNGMELAAATEEKETHSFEIDPAQVLCFSQMCIPIPKIF